jgi:hypothetical protein
MPLASPVTGHRLNWGNPAPDDIDLAVTIHCVDNEIIEWLECRSGGRG